MDYTKYRGILGLLLTCLAMILTPAISSAADDPLPSWNEGPTKQALTQFVQAVADKSNPDYVPPEDRIATIDNDGTLWVEQPIYTQIVFAIDRVKALVSGHPDLKTQPFFKTLLSNQVNKLTEQDIEKIMAVTHSGMTVEQFKQIESHWLNTARDKRFHRLYTDLIYQPMLEVIQYLRQNNFKVYIVSGGGQDFIRTYSDKTYGVPAEQIIGTAGKTKYTYQNNKPVLVKTKDVLFVDNYAGKAEAIDLMIGKKPIIAFGNSDGDRQMLEWTQSNLHKHLMLLVHHDDAKREYAYDTKSKVGTFSAELMQEAKQNNWQVISMKNDWKVIFPNTAKSGE